MLGTGDGVTVDEAASQEEKEEQPELAGVGEDGKEQPSHGELESEQRSRSECTTSI